MTSRVTWFAVGLLALSGCQNNGGASDLEAGLKPAVDQKGGQAESASSNLEIAGSENADEEASQGVSTVKVAVDQQPQAEDATASLASGVETEKSQSDQSGKKSLKPKPVDTTKTAAISKNQGKKAAVIASYRAPKAGTIFTYKNNWQSLEPKTVYKVVSTNSEFRGNAAIELKAIEGTGSSASTFHDASSFNLLGYRDKKGNSTITYTQVETRLKFPMKAGDKWISKWESYDHNTKKKTTGGGLVKVIGPEKIVVGAGRFKAMKLQLPLPPRAGRGMRHFIWYSPSLGVIIREQISNNTFSWSKELEKVKKPG